MIDKKHLLVDAETHAKVIELKAKRRDKTTDDTIRHLLKTVRKLKMELTDGAASKPTNRKGENKK